MKFMIKLDFNILQVKLEIVMIDILIRMFEMEQSLKIIQAMS
jgi:hypothetical protein